MKIFTKKTYSLLIMTLFAVSNAYATIGDAPVIDNHTHKVKSKSTSQVQNGTPIRDPEINSVTPLIYIVETDANHKPTGFASFCTGTLINSTTILTAAHCVLNMSVKAKGAVYTKDNLVSDYYLQDGNKNYAINAFFSKDPSEPLDAHNFKLKSVSEEVGVSSFYVNKDAFRGVDVTTNGLSDIDYSDVNDLAILKLSKEVPQFTASTDNKSYPQFYPSLNTGVQAVGQDTLIAGYAATSYSSSAGQANFALSNIEEDKGAAISIGKDYGGGYYTATCGGDSGGPDFNYEKTPTKIIGGQSVYTINRENSIIGVHSFGSANKCGNIRTPGTSMSVVHYKAWIEGGYLTDSIK